MRNVKAGCCHALLEQGSTAAAEVSTLVSLEIGYRYLKQGRVRSEEVGCCHALLERGPAAAQESTLVSLEVGYR